MKTLTSAQAEHPVTQATPVEIFADPVSYLRMLGIEAVLVVEPEALSTAA